MRNYKEKMNRYRIPKERYNELRKFCLCSDCGKRSIIETALLNTFSSKEDELSKHLYKHITSARCSWTELEVGGIPCNRDTFRLYRAKFYYELDKILKQINSADKEE